MSQRVIKNDTAVITAFLYQPDGVTPQGADAVTWSVLRPDKTSATVAPTVSEAFSVGATGGTGTLTGTYLYAYTWVQSGYETGLSGSTSLTTTNQNGTLTFANAAPPGVTARNIYRQLTPSATWRRITTLGPGANATFTDTLATDSTVAATPPFTPGGSQASLISLDTAQAGEYSAIATFTLSHSGYTQSVPKFFSVIDPLSVSATDREKTIDLAWMMFEDCFDSEIGGPHLRDASLANFDKAKMDDLFEIALYQINQLQPVDTYTDTSFPYAVARPLIAKALEIETIKHLMRSYVEQPNVSSSGSITYFERRDYLDRWNTLLTVEAEQFKQWIAMFKRQQYHFGTGKMLIDVKTRGLYGPAVRTRYPRGPVWGW